MEQNFEVFTTFALYNSFIKFGFKCQLASQRAQPSPARASQAQSTKIKQSRAKEANQAMHVNKSKMLANKVEPLGQGELSELNVF